MWSKSGFIAAARAESGAEFTSNYARPWFDPAGKIEPFEATMTLFVAHPVDDARAARGPFALWVGISIYALVMAAGNGLLNDPDTMWQITVGQWILDHRAVPQTDIYSFTMQGQPWISTQWLAQVMYAEAFAIAGWSGPVVLAASAIALTFALLARQVSRSLRESTTLVFVAAGLALTVPHLLARPHVLAMPVMILWIGGLIEAADRRAAPSFWLLPLLALWANLHGGFVFGLFLIGPIALDALLNAEASARKTLLARWAAFGLAALIASCLTPYGWNALLASQKILSLGKALPLISEWRPADFGGIGIFELTLLAGIGLALLRGVRLPPMRIALLLGLVHMALSQSRAAEMLALVAPLVLAEPLARQIGDAEASGSRNSPPMRGALVAGIIVALVAGTVAYASVHRYEPNMRGTPVAAVAELKTLNLARVFNDYDFGGYLIASSVPTFIDGRTELFGETFFVDHNNASGLMEPENLFRLLDAYKIEATLLRTQSAATKLLDHIDGGQKIYSDGIATIHFRKHGAMHTREPVVDATASKGEQKAD
jgi:hypothetical protein